MKRILYPALALLSFFSVLDAEARVNRKREPIRDSYVVVLKEDVDVSQLSSLAERLANSHGGRVQSIYKNTFKGFSVQMTDSQAEILSLNPNVEWVEEDAVMHLSTIQTTGPELWNLDRIDQSAPSPLSGTYSYVQDGTNVRAYILDTGIFAAHDEFLHGTGPTGTGTTRVEAGVSFVNDTFAANHPCVASPGWMPENTQQQINASYGAGHGTSVASILGGRQYGVAKEVILTPVRVVGCNGGQDVTRFLDGLDWILGDYQVRSNPAVVNISGYVLRWDPDVANADRDAIEASVNQLIWNGIVVVSSANNRNEDACWTSPAHIPNGITVGGSMINGAQDSRWVSANPIWSETNLDPASNWGVCVDIFAPAANIRSAHVSGPTAFRTAFTSGTSFAAPLVAGSVARYLQGRSKSILNPPNAWDYINSISTLNSLIDTVDYPLNGSPNKLLYFPPTF